MKRYTMTVNLETGAVETKEVDPNLSDEQAIQHAMDDCPLCREERARTGRLPEPVVLSRPSRPAPERPANWWHGRRKSTRRK